MYTQASQRRGFKARLQSVLEFCLSKLISRHGKRVLFVTSLYMEVVRLGRLKAEALGKLNTLMKIASCESALRLPVAMRGMVWSETGLSRELGEQLLDHELSDVEVRELSKKVVALTPSWLRYEPPAMATDVYELIRNSSQLAAA